MSTRQHSRPTARRPTLAARYSAPSAPYRRPLAFEPLEDRRLLAVVTVTTLADTIDFNDGVLSLREAIFATNTVPGADTIDFAPSLTASGSATILLTQGELKITDSLTINGPGASLLTIDASGSDPTPTADDGQGSRIFNIVGTGAFTSTVITVSGLTLTGGDSTQGGAISINAVTVTLTAATIFDNFSSGRGGAIHLTGSNLTVDNCTISDNVSAFEGGAIYYADTTISTVGRRLKVVQSEISNNSVLSGGGGAIMTASVNGGIIQILESRIVGNSAISGAGGGLSSVGYSSVKLNVEIDQTTIDHNTSNSGGGISSNNGNVIIRNSSIAENSAPSGGGGILLQFGTLTVSESTISGNTSINTSSGGGGISFQNLSNLSPGISLQLVRTTISNNSAGQRGGGIAANLGNGGALIDQCTIVENSATTSPGSFGGGIQLNGSPGGAVSTIQNSTFTDNSAGGTGGGLMANAHVNVSIANSTFMGNFAGRTGGATYSLGNLTLDGCTISGNSTADMLGAGGIEVGTAEIRNSAVSHNLGSGVVHRIGPLSIYDSVIAGNTTNGSGGGILTAFAPGVTAAVNHVTIVRSVITQNSAALGGGGLMRHSYANLTFNISDTTISDNTTGRDGGGIYITSTGALATHTIVNSSFINNTAAHNGGAIAAAGANIALNNDTFTQNRASINGGAIWVSTGQTILQSTFVSNRADQIGGNIFVAAGSTAIRNSIIALGLAPFGGDLSGVIGAAFDVRYSLIGTNEGSGLTPAPIGSADANGNLIGGSASGAIINPLLLPLTHNGGYTQTLAPHFNSPVINAGDPTAFAGTGNVLLHDQRGAPFVRIDGGRIDMGAVEYQPNPLPGDYNFNGTVDSADYLVWRRGGSAADFRADGNGDGKVDSADYAVWRANFGHKLIPPVDGGAGAGVVELAPSTSSGGTVAVSITEELPALASHRPLVVESGTSWSASTQAVARRLLNAATHNVSRDQRDMGLLAWLAASARGEDGRETPARGLVEGDEVPDVRTRAIEAAVAEVDFGGLATPIRR